MENPGKINFFRTQTDAEIQQSIDLYLTMDNLGGMICDDHIEELFRRQGERESNPEEIN